MTSLEKTLRWVVLGGVFILPFICLYVASSLFFPFITGKNFAFRIITEIITGAWLALALVNPAYRPRRTWILGAMALFVLIIAIADAQGVNAFKSFWSNYERMDGWVTIAHLLAYTVVAASVLNTEKIWKWLFWTNLGVSAVLSVWGFLQVAGISALGQGGAAGLSTARVDASFGNPIYMAVYMLFNVFIAALLWSQSWLERRPGQRLAPSLAYGAIIFVDTIALFLTGTRGTMIGLVAGAFVTAALVLVQANRSRNAWRASVAAIVGIIIVAGGFWSVRDAAWVHKVGFLERLATISTSDNTVKARFLNWSIAWEGVKEKPLLGWGQENYAIVFDKYYDPRMYGQEPWFDRVHNIVFDWLVAGGFLGLLSYLSIFAATLYALWRSRAFAIAERSIITGLLAGYFCHNFFVFDNVTSYILFGTVLAYVVYRESSEGAKPALLAERSIERGYLPYVACALAVCVWGVAWGTNASAIAANKALIQALMAQPDVTQNLALFEKSISYKSLGTQEAREQLAQAAASVAQKTAPVAIKQQFYAAATREMAAQAAMSPLDARAPLFLGVVFGAFGDVQNAAQALQHAHELSPKKQSIYFEMAQNAEARGDKAGALALWKAAYELGPEFKDGRLYYAAALINADQSAQAVELIAPLIASGEAADPRLLAALVAHKQYDKVAEIMRGHIAANPKDVQAYFTLAAVYYQAGDRARTIAALRDAEKIDPSVTAQADALIQQVQNGQ